MGDIEAMFYIFVRLIRDASWRGATRVTARQETQLKLQVVSHPAISTTILPRRVKWLYYADPKVRKINPDYENGNTKF